MKNEGLLLRAIGAVTRFVDGNKRNAIRIRSVAYVLVGVTAVITLYNASIDLSDRNEKFVSWRENYNDYQTTVLARSNSHLVIVTQFAPKGLCKFQGRSVGIAVQQLPGGIQYSRVLIGGEDFIGTYDIPKRGPEWVTFSPLKMATSGLRAELPFTLQYTADFKCDDKDVKIKFPIINVSAVSDE